MAEAVTYADLRFAKGAPHKSRPPADGPAAPPADGSEGEGEGEGELTYENCLPARPSPQQPGEAGQGGPAGAALRRTPDEPPLSLAGPGPWRRGRVPLLALLGSCLFLLATCLALGVRYWQVSGELQRASQRHAAESGALGQRIGSREEELERSLGQLDQARAELSATRLALWESWRAGNGTQRRLEEELTLLQRGKEEATRQLEEARRVLEQVASCQKNHCCPTGWKLFNEKCLWVSTAWKTWEGSRQDCETRASQLLMLKSRDAGNRHDAAAMMTVLQSDRVWIGLRKTWNSWEWHWVDGSRYEGTQKPEGDGECVKISQRTIMREHCSTSLRYVCEKAATLSSWPID